MVTVPSFLVPGLLVPGLLVPSVLVPGFLVPGLLVPGFSTNSYTRSRDRPGRTQQTGIFCGKALLLTSSGAREQESKSSIAYIFRSQSARAQECKSKSKRENGETPSLFKENYSPPRTYYSLIGCSPSAQLSSRERQNTWRENCPCTCADYVYHLEHSCQRHLVMANVRAAPHRSPFSFNKSNRPPILMRVEIEVKSPVCR